MSPPYMPLYVADYLSATEHLDASHSGAYLHLIMHYWQKGGLPDNDRFLARIARMTDVQWTEAKATLFAFFLPGWRHGKIDSLLVKAQVKSEARAEAGRRGGLSKSLNNNDAVSAIANDLQEQIPSNRLSKEGGKSLPSSSGLDIELASASSTPKRAGRSNPKEILLECLSSETAHAVSEHRKAKRSPLTELAARELVKGFLSTGDPEAAATMMVARGWQGFKLEWYENDKNNSRNGKQSVQDAARSNIERGVDFGPPPPRYMPLGRGDSASGDSPRLLPQGGRGGAGDLRSIGSGSLIVIPAGSGLSGDGSENGDSRQKPMATDSG